MLRPFVPVNRIKIRAKKSPAAPRSIVAVLGIGYLVLFGLWVFLHLFFFDANWVLALVNESTLYYFAPLVILMPLALLGGHTRLVLGLTVPLVVFLWLYGMRFQLRAPADESAVLTVASFNTLATNPDLNALGASISAAAPDILGMQEVSDANARFLESHLTGQFPYRLIEPTDTLNGIGLASKFPIREVTALPNPPFERGQRAVVQIGDKLVAVYVVHLAPPNMLVYPREQFASIAQDRYSARRAQATWLRDEIKNHVVPTLLLCDCNMSDASWTYAVLDEALEDTYRERGWGLGNTLMVGTPFAIQRYDYVWHTSELQPVSAVVGVNGGSDHLPVIARFRFP